MKFSFKVVQRIVSFIVDRLTFEEWKFTERTLRARVAIFGEGDV